MIRPKMASEEVVRIRKVGKPTEKGKLRFPTEDRLYVIGGPGSAVRNDLEAGSRETDGECAEVAPRIGHVRPRGVGRIPEVDLDRKRQPGLAKERTRPPGVVAVLLHVLRVADEDRRQELVCKLTTILVEGMHHTS